MTRKLEYRRRHTNRSVRNTMTEQTAIMAPCCDGGSTKLLTCPGGGGAAGMVAITEAAPSTMVLAAIAETVELGSTGELDMLL